MTLFPVDRSEWFCFFFLWNKSSCGTILAAVELSGEIFPKRNTWGRFVGGQIVDLGGGRVWFGSFAQIQKKPEHARWVSELLYSLYLIKRSQNSWVCSSLEQRMFLWPQHVLQSRKTSFLFYITFPRADHSGVGTQSYHNYIDIYKNIKEFITGLGFNLY